MFCVFLGGSLPGVDEGPTSGVMVVYLADKEAEGEAAIGPLRKLPLQFDTFHWQPYRTLCVCGCEEESKQCKSVHTIRPADRHFFFFISFWSLPFTSTVPLSRPSLSRTNWSLLLTRPTARFAPRTLRTK